MKPFPVETKFAFMFSQGAQPLISWMIDVQASQKLEAVR